MQQDPARIDVAALQRLQREENALTLLHVLPAEAWEAGHIPGSVQASVYEVGFLDAVSKVAKDKTAPVVVYGMTPTAHASREAAAKLVRAGYARVYDFRGGVAAWEEAGMPVERTRSIRAAAQLPDGRWTIDTAGATIRWLGSNLGGRHWGLLPVAEGWLETRDGVLTGGEIRAHLSALQCEDISDKGLAKVLLDHLLSDDFFFAEEHPTITARITGGETLAAAEAGQPQLRVDADLTIRGVTAPVVCAVAASLDEDGVLTCKTKLELDRTRWGVKYGSSRFFDYLGMHAVDDAILLQIALPAQRSAT